MPLKKINHKNDFKKGIPSRSLHKIQHCLLMDMIDAAKNGIAVPTHKANVFHFYYKNFNVKKRLKGKALCLLRTQFAKKPKNPV